MVKTLRPSFFQVRHKVKQRKFVGRSPAARKDAICTERCMKSAERFLCVILSEGGEAAEVEPVGRLGRGGILGGGNVASNGREDFVCHP